MLLKADLLRGQVRLAVSVLRPEVAASCLRDLRNVRIHPHFAGYLCLKRTATQAGRESNLKPNFREFWDTFLKVPGSSLSKPYVNIFLESLPSADNMWFNANVAGSYAPSSLRPDAPFRKAVLIEGEQRDARYSLRDRHWELAKQYLTLGTQVDAAKLAAFLYRDFAFETGAPTASTLVRVFREEFGYASVSPPDQHSAEFAALFRDDSADFDHTDWYEVTQ